MSQNFDPEAACGAPPSIVIEIELFCFRPKKDLLTGKNRRCAAFDFTDGCYQK